MSARRTSSWIAGGLALATALTLTGCLSIPGLGGPTTGTPGSASSDGRDDSDTPDPKPLDDDALEELMWEALPSSPSDFVVDTFDPLEFESFGSGWSSVDYDKLRSAGVMLTTESPGWEDASIGPGFWVDYELIRMDDMRVARDLMRELDGAVREPYSIDDDDVTYHYTPVTTPSGRWPNGSLEQARTMEWASGSTSEGWVVYHRSGELILIVRAAAIPGAQDALSAHIDALVPELVTAIDELAERLDTDG